MGKPSKGSRFGLGEPWQGQLADFCAAHYNASERDVVRAALEQFIAARLEAEPQMKGRYEQARKKRLGMGGDNIHIISGGKGDS